MYDIIIIGGGPAGLTAAVYARRANKTVAVIEKENFGGQITFSPCVENIPGFVSLSGSEFAEKLVDQAISQGVDFESGEVIGIREGMPLEDTGRNTFLVETVEGDVFEGKAVIIATGARYRMLGLPGEEELVGCGISFCAVCDGAFYKDQVVGVVGGGNSALQEAVLLSDLVEKLYIFQDMPYLTGEKKLQEKLEAAPNVEIITGVSVKGFKGERELTGVIIENRENGETKKYDLSGLFVAVGLVPQNEPFTGQIDLNDWGYADSDESCLTRTPGVFVAGDCRSKRIRQVATAAADGAVAAIAAVKYTEGAHK